MLALIMAGVLAGGTPPAQRFMYSEHCAVSNAGLSAAIDIITSKARPDSQQIRNARVTALRAFARATCDENAGAQSYGDWVARVDLAKNPSDYYLGRSSATSGEELDLDQFPTFELNELTRLPGQSFRAMHENEEHFGNRAVFFVKMWHDAAVHSAADGRLNTALVLNAFADHYLEDLMAPGHVRAQRTDVYDLFSMGAHDYFNRNGVTFRFRSLGDLEPFVRRLPTWILPAGVSGDSAAHRLLSLGSVTFRGDAQLSKSDDQRVFIAALIARSAADLLESFVEQKASDNDLIASLRWFPYEGKSNTDRLSNRVLSSGLTFQAGEYQRDTVTAIQTDKRSPLFWLSFSPTLAVINDTTARGVGRTTLFDVGAYWVWNNLGPEYVTGENQRKRFGGLGRTGLMLGGIASVGDRTVTVGPSLMMLIPIPALQFQGGAWLSPRWVVQSPWKDARVEENVGYYSEFGFGFVHLGLAAQSNLLLRDHWRTANTFNLSAVLTAIVPRRRF